MLMRRVVTADALSSSGAKAPPPMRAFSCDVDTGPNVTRRLLMIPQHTTLSLSLLLLVGGPVRVTISANGHLDLFTGPS